MLIIWYNDYDIVILYNMYNYTYNNCNDNDVFYNYIIIVMIIIYNYLIIVMIIIL